MCMNIIYVGFPGLGFQVKNLCVMFVFAIVSFLFFSEYQFAVDLCSIAEITLMFLYCTRLEFTSQNVNYFDIGDFHGVGQGSAQD
jgi:hypothetical protein